MIVCMYVDIRNVGIRGTLNAEPKDMGRDWERERWRGKRGLSVQINLHMEIRVILGTVLFNNDVVLFN